MNKITPIVLRLIILNVVIFIALQFLPKDIGWDYFTLHKSNLLGLHETTVQDFHKYYVIEQGGKPFISDGEAFNGVQVVTHFFNHGGIWHIFLNMWALANFGAIIEMVLGEKRFLEFYLFCGVVGGLLCAFLDPSAVPVVGASGAIFGVMVAFAIYFPHNKLTFMIPFPLTFEARTWILIFGAISSFFVISDYFHLPTSAWGGGISHFGHLAGMIAALIFFYGQSLFKKRM